MPKQSYYKAEVPAEQPAKHPGRTEGIVGIVCAVVALAFFPIIFGPAGIILGVLGIKKGEKALGTISIVLSAMFMVIGFIIGYMMSAELAQGAAGLIFVLK